MGNRIKRFCQLTLKTLNLALNVSHGDTGYHQEAGQQAIVATKATTQSILNQIGPK